MSGIHSAGVGGCTVNMGPQTMSSKLYDVSQILHFTDTGCHDPEWTGVEGCLCQLAQAANWLCAQRDTV